MIELFRSSIFLLHTCRGPHFARGRPFVAQIYPIGASQATLAQPRPNSSPGCPALLPAGRPAFSGVRQDPCRGTVVSLSLDPGHAQHPRWDDAADRDGTVTGVRCARRAPFRGRRCSWSPDVTSSSCARLFLPRRRFSGLGGHQFQLRIAASFLAGASGGLVLPGPHCAPAPPVTGDTSVGARLRSADRGDEPRMNGRAVLEVRGCATVTA
jgi:hypothetical protein